MSAEVIKMSNQDKDRNIALESAIGQIEKAFGKGSVMKLGTSGENLDVQADIYWITRFRYSSWYRWFT